MKWIDLHDLLAEQGDILSDLGLPSFRSVLPLWGDSAEDLRKLEFTYEHAIDDAVNEFAKSGKWPDLSPAERLMLWLRIEYAQDLCIALSVGQKKRLVAAPKGEKRRVIQWLLQDAWENGGFSSIHGTIESLLASAPPATRAFGNN